MLLTAVEARVLGSLMEKETTTPEVYPLSLNALVAACNQKSAREPVLQLSERDVSGALRSLEAADLVRTDHGSRVERFENRARTVFSLRRDEAALLCLLLLRGPQTPGELRGRADRLFNFDDVAGVLAALKRMGAAGEDAPEATQHAAREPLVTALPRQPGAREQRYVHLLCEQSTATPAEGSETRPIAAEAHPQSGGADLAQLLEAVRDLQERVERLESLLQPVPPQSVAPAQGSSSDQPER